MTDPLCVHGTAEQFKAGIHLTFFGLAAMCLGYNALAVSQRRERHLAVNVAVYAALLLWEAAQVLRHRDVSITFRNGV